MRKPIDSPPLVVRSTFALCGALATLALVSGCGAEREAAPEPSPPVKSATPEPAALAMHAPAPEEVRFSELHMLTDGGENAEAYFSFDGGTLVYQTTSPPYECDQILRLDLTTGESVLASTGRGRTTCAYDMPDGGGTIYASTHLGSDDCPAPPDRSNGYVWPIYPSYDLFVATEPGAEPIRLTETEGYDAEATVSPLGDRVVFTSMRDGDLDIYSMNLDGTDVIRLTDEPGYDGGPFYSPDGSMIVYRASRPETPEELADYRRLLDMGLIRPSRLDVWVMNADGSDKRQVTDLDAASFAPYFHPSGEKIIFSSNHHSETGREFDLFLVDLDGGNLEQVTFTEGFDGFPMFSPDGRWLAFGSNRHNAQRGETNVFLTRWRDGDEAGTR